jgi:hypothetical protein
MSRHMYAGSFFNLLFINDYILTITYSIDFGLNFAAKLFPPRARFPK